MKTISTHRLVASFISFKRSHWLVLAAALFGFAASGLANPSVVYVDATFNSGSSGGHTWNVDAFAAIQDGVTAVANGGTVNVAAGTYTENVVVAKPMTLLGANAGVDPRVNCRVGPARGTETIVDGGGIDATMAITFGTSNVTINGFTISGSGWDGNYNGGIYMTADVTGIQVLNNIITNNTEGIGAASSGACSIRTNLITANNTAAGPEYGAGVDCWVGDTDLTISDNEFSLHTQGNPILLEASAANVHNRVNITRNNFHDNANASAIYALGITNGVISQNQITAPAATCLSLSGGNNTVTVTNNFFSGADRGIRLEDAGYDAYYPGQGLDTNSNVRVYGNSFEGFTLVAGTSYAVGYEGGYSGLVLDASANWWGGNSEANVTGVIDGSSVDYTPWFDTGVEPVNQACDGFQGDFSNLHVSAASAQTGTDSSLKEAIDLVTANGTVNLAAGTYNDGVTINKTITIRGNQAGVTATTGRPGASETIISFAGGAFGLAANNIVLDGLVIQDQSNDNAGPGFGAGVFISPGHSGCQVLNCILQNNIAGLFLANNGVTQAVIQHNYFLDNNNDGAASGHGIYLDEFTSGAVDNVLIDDNRFEGQTSDGAGQGIGFSSSDPTKPTTHVTLSNNVFDSNGRAFYALNLQNSKIIDNTLANANYVGSADMRIFEGCANLTISSNLLQNGVEYAVRISDIGTGAAPATSITFTLNSIGTYGQAAPIDIVDYTGTFDAESNWWGALTGPTIAANIGGSGNGFTGSVDFSPWLGDGTDTSGAAGFQPNATPIYYTPTHLNFFTQPGSVLLGNPLSPQPLVEVLNEVNGRALQFNGVATMAIVSNPGGAVLTGTAVENIINGLATFTDLALSTNGEGFTLGASSPGLTSAVSAPITIATPPTINTQPVGTNVIFGHTNVFSVAAIGTPAVHYQWYFSNNLSSIVSKLPGRTNATLTIGPATFAFEGGYYVTITNTVGTTNSDVAQMKVFAPPSIFTQPVNFRVTAGTNVSFSVVSLGTAPLAYQWSKNGTAIPSATNTSLSFINVQEIGTNHYTCTVTNIAGSATTSTNQGILVVLLDVAHPTVSITYPSANFRLVNGTNYTLNGNFAVAPQMFIAGTAKDNGLITNVSIQQVFPTVETPIAATLSGTAPGSKTFTNTVTLADGTNTFHVWSTDSAGNNSTTNSVTGFFWHLGTLTVHTNGSPGARITAFAAPDPNVMTYSSATNQAQLVLTRRYGITATAGPNTVFTNWTDGSGNVLTNNPSLIFRMTSNLVLNANFVTNLIIANHLNGSYNGLFTNSAGTRLESAGYVSSLLVGTNRTFTGTLGIQGQTYTITGTIDLSGNGTTTVVRPSRGNLAVALHLDLTGGSKAITGTVVSTAIGNSWTSSLLADQATNSLPVANAKWTMIIPPTVGAPASTPGGSGYATITNYHGTLTIAGKLADGTVFSQSAPLSKDGTAPLHPSLYNGNGFLEGMLDLSSGSPVGYLTWIKKTSGLTTYVQGITNEVFVSGSAYTPPPPGFRALPLPGNVGTLMLDPADGGIGAQADGVTGLYWSVLITPGNTLTVNVGPGSVTNRLVSGSIAPSTGIITIIFRPTGSLVNKTCVGIVDQSAHVGQGAFIGTTETGGFDLQ